MDPDITENIASRKLRNPRLEIGGAVFPEECMREAEIRFAGDDHVRSRSAYVVLTPPAELRNCHEITCSLLHAQLYLMGDS